MMQYEHTWAWVVGTSPHTGKPKIQTRRITKKGDICRFVTTIGKNGTHSTDVYAVVRDGRTVYEVGKTYAVQTGRTKPSIWINGKGGVVESITYRGERDFDNEWVVTRIDNRPYLKDEGYYPARIRILSIWREDVRQICSEDVESEGFQDIGDFLETWAKMHDKPLYKKYEGMLMANRDTLEIWPVWEMMQEEMQTRPDHMYDAWTLTFELVKGIV